MRATASFVDEALGSPLRLRVVAPARSAEAAWAAVRDEMAAVDAELSRFRTDSQLTRLNRSSPSWVVVGRRLRLAMAVAWRAYRSTHGRFDPRIIGVLEAMNERADEPPPPSPPRLATGERWLLRDRTTVAVTAPVDLGGIGKGLAVRWASQVLAGAGRAVLVEAGGDLFAAGPGPDGTGWRVGVEDPRGGPDPVAVLGLEDLGCATSSVRVRHWRVNGRAVHHIVDPRTGEPADSGLLSVTVVGPDPALAEIWSKALFLAGRGRVRRLADERGIAALLVDTDGFVGVSRPMRQHLVWQAPRGF